MQQLSGHVGLRPRYRRTLREWGARRRAGRRERCAASKAPARRSSGFVGRRGSGLKMLVGEYIGPEGNLNAVDAALVEDKLMLRPCGSSAFPPLRPLGANRFATAFGESTVLIEFKQDGEETVLSTWDVTANESGGNDLRRIPTWRPTDEALRSYSGVYVGDKVDIPLYVRADGDRLLMAGSGSEESWLTPQAKPDEFRLPAQYWARFERDEEGKVNALSLDAVRVKGIGFSRRQ